MPGLLLCIVAGALSAQQTGKAPGCASGRAVESSGLAAAWETFRVAVLAGDTEKVAGMVHFPLLSSGVVDDDPAVKVERAGFPEFLQRFLAAPSGETPDGASTKQFIAYHRCLSDRVLNESRDGAQIANMVFVRKDGAWRLTQVYSASE